jgi:hypothetical protein
MTAIEFRDYWHANFAECPPINYLLKINFKDRWLRIHSLPGSKRYAENKIEWDILLARQNKILQNVFDVNDAIVIISNTYKVNSTFESNYWVEKKLENYIWHTLPEIDIFNISKKFMDKDVFIIPHVTTDIFEVNKMNFILQQIATDELRLFFMNPKTNTIVAPYDGGVDIIYVDTATRDMYKEKYRDWAQQEIY